MRHDLGGLLHGVIIGGLCFLIIFIIKMEINERSANHLQYVPEQRHDAQTNTNKEPGIGRHLTHQTETNTTKNTESSNGL